MTIVFDAGKHCGAKNRHGTRCTLAKGYGTDHRGRGRCKFHGGSTPNARRGARREAARAILTELAVPIPTNPLQLLSDLVDQANGMVKTAARLLREVDKKTALTSDDAEIRIRLLRETMLEAGRLAKMASEAVNEDTLVQISVRTGELIHRALTAALDAYEKAPAGEGRRLAEDTLVQELMVAAPAGDERN